MNNHNKNMSITNPSISHVTRNLIQTNDNKNVEVLCSKTNKGGKVGNDNTVIIYIRKDYVPRDKITDAHISLIIRTKYNMRENVVKKERYHF